MVAKSPVSRRHRWPNAIRWGIGVFTVIGITVWFLNKPDPEATRRQQICQSWGITDAEVLAKCRQSAEQEGVAVEPFRRSAAEREIAWFNQDLSALSSGKTRASDADYPNRSIEEVEKVAGGMLGAIIGPIDSATFPAKSWPAKLAGVIVTHEPDPDDAPDVRQSEPRYFTVETETPPRSANAAHEAYMPTAVNLDIESLNRYERQFIIDHCHPVWATPCRATVLGHVDEIVGRRSAGPRYVGIVADQLDVEPLNWSTARPDWMLSTRSLVDR